MEERPAGTGVKAPAQRERIALFDNVKGLLIVLVVFGHIAHPVHNSNPVLSALFDIIYLFHMPLFVLVSGLFAKGAYRDGKLNVNRIISFAVLGLAFQLALALVNGAALTPRRIVSGLFAKGAYRDGKLNVNRIISFAVLGLAFQLALALVNGAALTPRRILAFTSAPWYLISMAAWYAMTPILARLGAARGMAASLAIALCWGAVDLSSGLLAISRTMAFLPCFALGYYLRPATIIELRARKGLWLAVGAAALTAGSRAIDPEAFAWFFPMVYGDNPYELGFIAGVAQKLTALAVGGAFSLAVLKLVPMRRCRLTALGQRTLQVYVLHRLIRAWLTFHTPLYDLPVMNDPVLGTAIALAMTAAVTALCAAPIFLHRLIRAWLTFHTPLYDLPVMNDPVLGTAIALAMTAAVTALCAAPIFEAPFARVLGIRWTRD